MPRIGVYPGSFDPPTLGHLDLIARAAKLFDELHVLVVHNPNKTPHFSVAERIELLKSSLAEAQAPENIRLENLGSGLLVNYCRMVSANALVKGVRTTADLDYELPMALVNRDLASVETLFLPADPRLGQISSSLVRQVAMLEGDVSPYVPAAVAKALAAKYRAEA